MQAAECGESAVVGGRRSREEEEEAGRSVDIMGS